MIDISQPASVICGDALALLRELPDACADALITDPPYSSGGFTRGDRAGGSVAAKYISSGSGNKTLAAFAGDNRDQRGYLTWSTLWLAEALRVVRPGGVAAVFTDWRQLPTTTDALQAGGWVWRGIVPWYKPSSRPQMGRFNAACEYVVWGSAGALGSRVDVGVLPGFYQGMAPQNREHITQKPIDVMRQIVRICTPGGLVLDPFAGSGTTGAAAVAEERRFLGIEAVPHFADVAARRVSDALASAQPALLA